MPLLDKHARDYLRNHPVRRCTTCGENIRLTYCRSEDEFFQRGHADACVHFPETEVVHKDCRIDTGEGDPPQGFE